MERRQSKYSRFTPSNLESTDPNDIGRQESYSSTGCRCKHILKRISDSKRQGIFVRNGGSPFDRIYFQLGQRFHLELTRLFEILFQCLGICDNPLCCLRACPSLERAGRTQHPQWKPFTYGVKFELNEQNGRPKI